MFAGQPCVTARDFTHDPRGGLSCEWLAAALQRGRDQRIKYVIWDHCIMAGQAGPSPWAWRPYRGANPHERHLHLSVVPDDRALTRIPWQLPDLEDDDMSAETERLIREIHTNLEAVVSRVIDQKLGSGVWDYRGHHLSPEDNVVGQVLSIRKDLHGGLDAVLVKLDELAALVRVGVGQGADPQVFAGQVAADLARRLEG